MCGFDKRFGCEMDEKWHFKWFFVLLFTTMQSQLACIQCLGTGLSGKNWHIHTKCAFIVRNSPEMLRLCVEKLVVRRIVRIVVTIVTFSCSGVHWHQIGCCVLYFHCTEWILVHVLSTVAHLLKSLKFTENQTVKQLEDKVTIDTQVLGERKMAIGMRRERIGTFVCWNADNNGCECSSNVMAINVYSSWRISWNEIIKAVLSF